MDGIPVERKDYQELNNSLTLAGLCKRGPEYEEHFSSNKKVLVFYKGLMLEVRNIEYCDNPEGDLRFEELDGIAYKRRFGWEERLVQFPQQMPLSPELVIRLIYDGFSNGLPMGIVFGDNGRKTEALKLGELKDGEFCKYISLGGTDELRIYEIPEGLPVFDAKWGKPVK